MCTPFCGDGIIVGNEQCDDRNSISGDGCSSICTIDSFYACSGQPSICFYNGPTICGNKRIEKGEECDDGNRISGDGCSERCQKEAANPYNPQ